ncbi:hypothetical protein FXO38_15544 [Capsicum annuum]|uniref:Auxin-responsive protein n=1 Tax=Capsicum annuum TaxID=4072 RepID=A0A2G2ZBU8_CAPAN|nr:hypothetical protein FXO37_28201 [Capsicum annuum]KAF3653682.1 hypothetical protein FXO38_15544 [Capsicum annuum]PHT79424.1 hypothetical protein T459_17476 [Capsicum annuum]
MLICLQNFQKYIRTQVVGWPPVRSQRKKEVVETKKWCKYLKVAVDGVPYLRKVDLEMFTTYDQLLSALTDLFTICKYYFVRFSIECIQYPHNNSTNQNSDRK